MKNIEKSRNTEEQINFYDEQENFIANANGMNSEKFRAFPVFATRQSVTYLLERYQLYMMAKNVPGNIIECGVGNGFGLMSFAHFCSIYEPYHYVRKIVGFDTFEGFTPPDEKDMTSKAGHMKEGGLHYDSYETLLESIKLYDKNRALGHIEKVEIIKGDISKTLPKYLEENPQLVVSILYLDMDLYKPTKDTIELLYNRLPKGGMIVFDELNHSDYPGETIALMETIGTSNLKLERLDISSMLAYAKKD
ncbi:MAG: class I SAM-dependent methyltransferase [Helicobacteraceae bacterium]|nr:class I SAM-dependent methyltransferase [Helicobacteraceae bacterium]